jgi:hypothetical protein
MKILERNGLYLILGLSLGLCLLSCSMFVPNLSNDKKSSTYSIKFASSDWLKIPPNTADLALKKDQTGSIIFVNSICQKYNEVELTQLTDNILRGIDNLKIERKEEINYSERKAIRTSANGLMDGVPTFLDFLTVKKSGCVYDFVLICSKKDARQKDLDDFQTLLNSVTIE